MQIKIEDYLSESEIKDIVGRALFKKVFESRNLSVDSIVCQLYPELRNIEHSPEEDAKDFYVYSFVNDDFGVPFFVGKGCGNRYKQFSGRSKHVEAILKNYRCHSEILVGGLSEDVAYKKEKEYKKKFKELGYPIIDSELVSNHDAQRAGVEKAKAEDKYKGRRKIHIKEDEFKTVIS